MGGHIPLINPEKKTECQFICALGIWKGVGVMTCCRLCLRSPVYQRSEVKKARGVTENLILFTFTPVNAMDINEYLIIKHLHEVKTSVSYFSRKTLLLLVQNL
jgi:hypothetical protein